MPKPTARACSLPISNTWPPYAWPCHAPDNTQPATWRNGSGDRPESVAPPGLGIYGVANELRDASPGSRLRGAGKPPNRRLAAARQCIR